MTTPRIPRRIGALALAGAAALVPVAPLAAQPAPRVADELDAAAPVRTVHGFLARYRLDAPDGGRVAVDGVGGRVLWTAGAALANPGSLAARTAVGVFGVFLPEQSRLGVSVLHAGADVSVRPLAVPLPGGLEPTLSLGVGGLRMGAPDRPPLRRRAAGAAAPGERSHVALAVSPGVGVRVALAPGLGLHGDVRDVVTARNGPRHNVAWGVGLGMTF